MARQPFQGRASEKDIQENRNRDDPATDPPKDRPAGQLARWCPATGPKRPRIDPEHGCYPNSPLLVIACAPMGEQTPGPSERSFRGFGWREAGRIISARWRCRRGTVSTTGRLNA